MTPPPVADEVEALIERLRRQATYWREAPATAYATADLLDDAADALARRLTTAGEPVARPSQTLRSAVDDGMTPDKVISNPRKYPCP